MTTMKINAICWRRCLFALLLLWPVLLAAQRQYRYVFEVKTVPQVKQDKAKHHPVEKSKAGHPKKTVEYYEILSAKPLTLKQCQALVSQGKAKRIPAPKRNELDPLHRRNLTLEGETDVNIWDIDPTEYDLMHEDPDLYDFIAD